MAAGGDGHGAEHPPAEHPRAKGPNWNMLVPLMYAPMLPMIRIGLRGRVPKPTLDKIFAGAIVFVLGHAGYIMSADSTV